MKWVKFKPSASLRFLFLLFCYTAVLAVSRYLAYQLRFDFDVPPVWRQQLNEHWLWVISLKLGLLLMFRQFAGLLSYFSVPDLERLFLANLSASGVLMFIRWNSGGFYSAPRGVILMDLVLSFAGLCGLRLGFRVVRERFLMPSGRAHRRMRRVGIFGAGDAGASLVRELKAKRGLGLLPVAFFDDDKSKWKSRVHEIPVVGRPEAILDHKLNLELEEVIIAMPSAPAKRIGELVKLLQRSRLKFETVPSM